MKNALTLLFFAISIASTTHAQTTNKTDLDFDNNVRIKYSVLKADKSVKQGPYNAYNPYDNRLLTEGFYKNNLKDSIWKQYGFKLIEAGMYKDGQKVGIWNAYNYKGELTLQYDYTNAKLLVYKPEDADSSKNFFVINGADTLKALLDRPPIYLDGYAMAMRSLLMTMRYPKAARENNITGQVHVGFTIGTDGKASGYHIVQSLGYGCDEAAITSVKKIDGDWLPGILNGKPVAVEYIIPINFTLNVR